MLNVNLETGYKKFWDRLFRRHTELNPRKDQTLRTEVWKALWQADDLNTLDIRDINIVVRQGEVWLSGKVTDAQQCKLAEYLVKDINGVRNIHNRLTAEPG